MIRRLPILKKGWCVGGAVVPLVALLVFSSAVFAQERSYKYESIEAIFSVKEDSTVEVEEKQTYRFVGEYHQGWRSIPITGTDGIDNISVADATKQLLVYSPSRLDKTDPESWGKYTTFKENGEQVIEWYYDARDTRQAWILRYTLHGAISFLDNHDELYWNLFTSYDVPVDSFTATVLFPRPLLDSESTQSTLYTDPRGLPHNFGCAELSLRSGVRCSGSAMPSQSDVTLAVGWPKGLVSQAAYFQDLLLQKLFTILSVLVAIATIVTLLVRWYLTEKRGMGRGTIVPEYEPPQNLSPAYMDVLLHEGISSRAWSATIVDLAVRGYVTITEDEQNFWNHLTGVGILSGMALIFFAVGLFLLPLGLFNGSVNTENLIPVLIVGILLLVILLRGFITTKGEWLLTFKSRDYTVSHTEKNSDDIKLYEEEFLSALMEDSSFSTRALQKSQSKKKALYEKVKKITENLYKEVERETGVYAVGISKEKTKGIVFSVLFAVAVAVLFIVPVSPVVLFIITLAGSGLLIYFFFNFEARLTKEGAILREKILGFKMYLETAEKYRMQNLTPEIFEKYLPYAMIFGVEKKWGKAFEGITMPPPSWYHSAGVVAISADGGGIPGGFSPAGFSAAFSSSFSSAFSSAGGSGASGGGGGAGGGGGGGGGGAS